MSSRFTHAVAFLVTRFLSFLILNNIQLHVYATFCLSVHPLMDVSAAYTSWLL